MGEVKKHPISDIIIEGWFGFKGRGKISIVLASKSFSNIHKDYWPLINDRVYYQGRKHHNKHCAKSQTVAALVSADVLPRVLE